MCTLKLFDLLIYSSEFACKYKVLIYVKMYDMYGKRFL